MKMLFDYGTPYNALRIKHGSRLPEVSWGFTIRVGWYPLVNEMLDRIAKDYPSVRFQRIGALSGWLRLEHSGAPLDANAHMRFRRMIQGFVTQSLVTCEECGSTHADYVDATAYGCGTAMNRTLCADCVRVFEKFVYADRERRRQEFVHDHS
ncbi:MULTISPECIES: hypothetical protein [unclassified Rhizobium]|uniref:hypothetical protein n=1 Tax=unclassified Rhizobium TaxID=2613769 RepID=UPI000B29026E|nr:MULTISPECIES: hypothetical protein [unclassified Rhizobium]